MSYKDELKKQIEELENQVNTDQAKLSKLYRELSDINIKEMGEAASGQQQLLQG